MRVTEIRGSMMTIRVAEFWDNGIFLGAIPQDLLRGFSPDEQKQIATLARNVLKAFRFAVTEQLDTVNEEEKQ